MFSSNPSSTFSNPILTNLRKWKHDYENEPCEYPRKNVLISGVLKVEIALAIDSMTWTENIQGITEEHICHAKEVMKKFAQFEV